MTNPTLERIPLRHDRKDYEVVRDAQGVLRVTCGSRVLAPQGAVVRALRAAYPAAFEPASAQAPASAIASLADALVMAAKTGLTVRFGRDELSETGGHFVALTDLQPETLTAAVIQLVNLVRQVR